MINFPDAPTIDQIFVSGPSTWKWDGVKWGPTPFEVSGGDITAVLAGTGLNGGGTTGDVTLNLTAPVSIANGGTEAITAPLALANLGGAPINSPVFTGNPTAPTPTAGDSDTSLATTAFVTAAIGGVTSGISQADADTRYVNITGDTMSGDLTITKSDPALYLNGGTGTAYIGCDIGEVWIGSTANIQTSVYVGDTRRVTFDSTNTTLATNLRINLPSYPKWMLNRTTNAVDIKKWQSYVTPSGTLAFGSLNDAENLEGGQVVFTRIGGILSNGVPVITQTTLTAAFTTPGIGGTVVASVNDASWMVVNAQLFIVDAYYNINSIAGNNITLQRTA